MIDWRDLLLAVSIRGVDKIAARLVTREGFKAKALPAARQGVSILIPERGTPTLLAACLASVEAACALVEEPSEVHVVVNGSNPRNYDALALKHPFVKWHFFEHPLGFHGAIRRGLDFVAYDWVYLLNSDMTLARDAVAQLLPLRDHRTFAIASQIFFADKTRRREETGWTDYWVDEAITQHFDRTPETLGVRGHLYASGGASLFRVAPLRRYVASSGCYAPFYFEDADWGVQAARAGYAVKFCPLSTVSHVHRATINQFYAPKELARIVRRNQLLFEARHGLGGRARMLEGEDPQTRSELTSPRILLEIIVQRWRSCRARRRGFSPALSCDTMYTRPFVASLPTALIFLQVSARIDWQRAVTDADACAARMARSANVVLVLDGVPADPRILPMELLGRCVAVHVVRKTDSSKPSDVSEQARIRQRNWWRCIYATKTEAPTTDLQESEEPIASRIVTRRLRTPARRWRPDTPPELGICTSPLDRSMEARSIQPP